MIIKAHLKPWQKIFLSKKARAKLEGKLQEENAQLELAALKFAASGDVYRCTTERDRVGPIESYIPGGRIVK